MARINEDGNLFGRIAALIVIAAAICFVMRTTGGYCPVSSGGKGCCFSRSGDLH